MSRFLPLIAAALLLAMAPVAEAVSLRITVENLAPENSVSLAPLRFGVGNGTFDAFNNNEVAFLLGEADIASAPIVSVAEGGSGSTWFPAFAAAEPDANLGSVLPPPGGPFLPGGVSSTVVEVDPTNQYFTFATMVVPSNDHFLGNANPTAFQIFDNAGNLILDQIEEDASRIWDAGSEQEIPENAAFLAIGTNANRVDEGDPVQFNFSDLSAFNGLETAAGYNFDSSLLASDTPVLRVSFAVVPEPASFAIAGVGALGLLLLRRRVAKKMS